MELRRKGLRYEQIATELGISEAGAWQAIQRAYKRSLKLTDDEADSNRKLDLERIDVALAAIWEQVIAGKLFAIDRLVMLLERRARLLGLDKPEGGVNGAIKREYVGVDVDAV